MTYKFKNFIPLILVSITALFLNLFSSYLIAKNSTPNTSLSNSNPEVKEFINYMVKTHHFDKQELTKLFKQAEHQADVIKAMKRPAEKWPWHRYQNLFLKDTRIQAGVKFWQQHEEILNKASKEFQVPPEVIVSIIGVETFYGKHKGKYPVFDCLATLAFDYKPRAKFFKSELEQFLLYAKEEKKNPKEFYGSYAGAMGYPQFISSSIRHYAVDFSKDGRRDLLNDPADAIGSVANYLKTHGWQIDKPVVNTVSLDKKQEQKLSSKINKLKPSIKLGDIKKLGVLAPNKNNLEEDQLTSLLSFETNEKNDKEYRLAYNNFYVITRYNISQNYALAVYLLSEEIKKEHAKQYNLASNNKKKIL